MRFAQLSLYLTFFIIANAVSIFDDRTAIGEPEVNSEFTTLDGFNTDSTTLLDNLDPCYIAPDGQYAGNNGDFPKPDILTSPGDSTAVGDSSNCAGNLGKREDNGFTSGKDCLRKDPVFSGFMTETTQCKPVCLYPNQNPTSKSHSLPSTSKSPTFRIGFASNGKRSLPYLSHRCPKSLDVQAVHSYCVVNLPFGKFGQYSVLGLM